MHLNLLSQGISGHLVRYADCLFVHSDFDFLSFSANLLVSCDRTAQLAGGSQLVGWHVYKYVSPSTGIGGHSRSMEQFLLGAIGAS